MALKEFLAAVTILSLIAFMLLIATGCGKKIDNHSGDLQAKILLQCSATAFDKVCTSAPPTPQYLTPLDFYDYNCYDRYQICVDNRGEWPSRYYHGRRL